MLTRNAVAIAATAAFTLAASAAGDARGDECNDPTGKVHLEEKDGVFIVEKDKAVFRPIKTGIVGETDAEVLEGLKEGEEIVTGSFKTLRGLKDQAKIKVETKKERP